MWQCIIHVEVLTRTFQLLILNCRHLTSRVQVGSPVTMRLLTVPAPMEEGETYNLMYKCHLLTCIHTVSVRLFKDFNLGVHTLKPSEYFIFRDSEVIQFWSNWVHMKI